MSELQEIFNACLNVPAFQREELLGRLCAENEPLQQQVRRLLDFDQENQVTRFLEPTDPSVRGWANRVIGSCIGLYQITGLVGAGGFGTVYRAQRTRADVDDQQAYAVKVLHPWLVNTSAFQRFRREEQALQSVNHPHVARFIDSGVEPDGSPYLVTAFVEGVSLEQRVVNSQGQTDVTEIPIATRVGWLIDICQGVQAAHERLILHRDLKPSNILISHDNRAVVTDFGIAKHLASNEGPFTSGQGLLGTIHFMAPEQLDRQGELGLSADIYGIGGLTYFLLTGKPPHSVPLHSVGGDKPQIEPPRLPRQIDPTIPTDLETICLKCLHHQSERRYAAADLVAGEMTRFLHSEPIMARPVGYLEAAGYWIRRNQMMTRLIGTSLIGGLVAVGSIIYLWQQATRENQRAEQNLRTAVESYQTLHDVIDRFLDALQVAEQNPATTQVQLELLLSLNKAYEHLTKTSEQDHKLQRSHAVCLFKLGLVQKQFEQMDAYAESIEKAESLFLALAQWEPENPQHWFDVFHCRNAMRRMNEALEAIAWVCTLDGGSSLDYLDCLAHTKIQLAEVMLVDPATLNQAVQLCDQASVIAAKNLQSAPEHWRYWKKMGEIYSMQAKIAVASNDCMVEIEVRLEQGNEAYRQALRLLPNDRELLRLIRSNIDLKLMQETLSRDWVAAAESAEQLLELALEYQSSGSRTVNHYRFVAWALEAIVFVACMDQRHDDAIDHGHRWRDAVDVWVAAFPVHYQAKLEQTMCDAALHRLYPSVFSADRFAELSHSLQVLMTATNPVDLLPLQNIVALYLLGEQEASRRLAEEIFQWEPTIDDPMFDSERPWRLLFSELKILDFNQPFNLDTNAPVRRKVKPEMLNWRSTFFPSLLE